MFPRNGRVLMASASRYYFSSSLATTSSLRQTVRVAAATRFYSQTRHLYKRSDDDDEGKERIVIPGLPDIQTLNTGNMTDEEIKKILEDEERRMEQEEKEKYVENWKPGMRKRPLQMSYSLEEFEYELEPEKHKPRWTPRLDRRCGALAIKVGMMPVFDDYGIRHPCTVLFMDKNIVLGHKTMEKHGYIAVSVAAGERKRKNVGKCLLGQYKHVLPEDNPLEHPPYLVREFRVSDAAHLIPVGQRIHAMHFVPGQNVDVSGTTKGKGFQGAMKRHGFAGMPASHGVSKSHRALGSTGQCQDPGKVFKGKKMAGRMGSERRTTQNLRIIKIDRGRNLVFVEGSVPGNAGHFVELRDAVKKPLWKTDSVPDKVDRPPLPTFEYDEAIDGCGQPGHDVMMPMPAKDPLASDMDDEAA